MKFKELRKKYPKFIYENCSYKISGKNLEIFFDFKIEPNPAPEPSARCETGIYFKPKIIIENIPNKCLRWNLKHLNNLVFHLGLIEIPSYWKATCSAEIEIKAGFLNKEQIKWWKDLILKGMGQFFYENQIDFTQKNFLKIISLAETRSLASSRDPFSGKLRNRFLIPIGGGKDSVVTLEILKKAKKNIQCFSLNPTKAAQKIMMLAGCKKPIIIRRKIDEKLLELNRRGFLNGHTPFSAYLAFLSVLVASIFDYKYIVLSNERSSNEGNVKYLSKIINHQWSKSFEFEQKFRAYSQKYLTPGVEYFSFLRPLYEIQIAKLFSRYPKYFSAFLSCNEAYKTASGTKLPIKRWCGNCSKCLFIFATLYPFTDEKKLIKIFGKNLFENKKLLPTMEELIGEKKFKPFECVGTKKESLTAFYLSWKKYHYINNYTPVYLLRYFEEKILPKYPGLEKESIKILNSWNKQHNLPKESEKVLKKTISQ
jgi:hypothetical protein